MTRKDINTWKYKGYHILRDDGFYFVYKTEDDEDKEPLDWFRTQKEVKNYINEINIS